MLAAAAAALVAAVAFCLASGSRASHGPAASLNPQSTIRNPQSPALPSLAGLVLHKAERLRQGEYIALSVAGRDLGRYRDPERAPIRRIREHAARYQPPEFFAVLDAETIELPVADGLKLGQLVAFVDKRGADGRKTYTTERHTDVFPPSQPLIEKLTRLRERLRAQGVRISSFWITSGFRTPEYNAAIGGAAFSRHCYGDAADLVVDEDGDRRIDDLNRDGRHDRLDGVVVARACEELEREGAVARGGIGVYEWDAADSVGSHVHVDCRGYRARWGQITRGRQKTNFQWWTEEGAEGDAAE